MNGWIEKNIDPPGIHQKNRGSLFSAVGKIFAVVRDDALTAFNAHFPYLADERKLAEHGRALEVPRFVNDSDGEYRDRVTAASFYHMKTGERGYIKSQLAAHFGDRFITKEEFLQIYVQVLDLADDEIAWAHNFLDSIVDPNVGLKFGKWKKLIDAQVIKDKWNILITNKNIDAVLVDTVVGIRLHLLFREEMGPSIRYDGQYAYDGSIRYQQNPGWHDAVRIAAVPQNTDRVYHGDTIVIALKLRFKDTFNRLIKYDGTYRYDGSVDYYSERSITDRVSIKADYTEKIHDTGTIAGRVLSGIIVRPVTDTVKAAGRVTGGITVQPVDTLKAAARITGGITLQPIADTVKAAGRVTGGIAIQPADTAGMKSKVSIRVQKSTEYNGEITYDGSHEYGGYTVEEYSNGTD
jgi:hypothetical protein